MSFAALALLIAYFLQRSAGHYDSLVIWYALAFFALLAWAVRAVPRRRDFLIGVFALLVTIRFSIWSQGEPRVIHAQPSEWMGTFAGLLSLRTVLAWMLLGLYFFWRRGSSYALALYALATIIALSLVPVLSPAPAIDVFVSNTAAADFLLSGQNPYAQTYKDIYAGSFGYEPGFFYWPGLLLAIAPARAVFGDIRYAFVIAHVVIALCLWGLGRGSGRRRLLAPALWLSFPVGFFVLEQSWIDTLLLACAAAAWLAYSKRKLALAAVCAGLAISVKQYGFVFALVLAADVYRTQGARRSLRFGFIAAATALTICLPFLLAAPEQFIRMTLGNLAGQAARPDALNLTAWLLRERGLALPPFLQAMAALLGLAGAAGFVAWGGRAMPGAARAALGALFAFGMSFFFGKFAFCNYHYLLAGIACLGLASGLGRRADFRLED